MWLIREATNELLRGYRGVTALIKDWDVVNAVLLVEVSGDQKEFGESINTWRMQAIWMESSCINFWIKVFCVRNQNTEEVKWS